MWQLYSQATIASKIGKVFQNNVMAAAIIDRLVQHAKILYINGASYRLKNKLKKTNWGGQFYLHIGVKFLDDQHLRVIQ